MKRSYLATPLRISLTSVSSPIVTLSEIVPSFHNELSPKTLFLSSPATKFLHLWHICLHFAKRNESMVNWISEVNCNLSTNKVRNSGFVFYLPTFRTAILIIRFHKGQAKFANIVAEHCCGGICFQDLAARKTYAAEANCAARKQAKGFFPQVENTLLSGRCAALRKLRCVAMRCSAWRKLSCVERNKFCYYYDLTHSLLVLEANNHGEHPRPTKRNEKPNIKNDKYILHSTIGILFK